MNAVFFKITLNRLNQYKQRLYNSRLARDSFWALAGNVVGKGLALAAGIVIARLLGREIYGEYGMIKNTIMSLAILSTFGLGFTSTKFIAENKNKNPRILSQIIRYSSQITLVFSGLMALVLLLSASYLADTLLNAPNLATPLRILAGLVVFNALTTTQIGVLSGFGEFKTIAKVNGLVGLATFFLSLGLTYCLGFNGAVFALLAAQIINWILFKYKVKKVYEKFLTTEETEKQLIGKIIKFSLPIALQEAQYSIATWLLAFLLIKMRSFGDLGMYSAAMQWFSIVLFIPGALKNVILTHLSESNQSKKSHDLVLKRTLLINFISTLGTFFIIYFATSIIEKAYGSSFTGLGGLLIIAVLAAVFNSLNGVYVQAFISKGRNWEVFLLRAARDFGIIAFAFIFMSYYPKIGGAYIILYGQLFINLAFFFLLLFIFKTKNNKT